MHVPAHSRKQTVSGSFNLIWRTPPKRWNFTAAHEPHAYIVLTLKTGLTQDLCGLTRHVCRAPQSRNITASSIFMRHIDASIRTKVSLLTPIGTLFKEVEPDHSYWCRPRDSNPHWTDFPATLCYHSHHNEIRICTLHGHITTLALWVFNRLYGVSVYLFRHSLCVVVWNMSSPCLSI